MARPAQKTAGSDHAAQNQARMLNRIIFGVALFGTLLTLHLWIQSERGFSHGCFGFSDPADVGVVECTAVLQSDAGKLFGISNIVYGFFFFGVIAILSLTSVLAQRETAKKVRKASFLVASIGVAYALYLFSYQVFVLGQFCWLCLTTGLTTAVVFGLHAVEWAGKSVARFELSDLVREVGLFVLMTLVAGMLLVGEVFFLNRIGTLEAVATAEISAPAKTSAPTETLAPVTDSAVPAFPSGGTVETTPTDLSGSNDVARPAAEEVKARLDQQCQFDPAMAEIPNVAALTRSAPYVGSDTASVSLIEFFDPNCPHCKTLHQDTPAIMAQLGGRARIYYRPYPIWPYSYTQVEALYQADDEGLFHEMLQVQMDRQKRGGLSIAELADIAGDLGMDVDQFRRNLNGGKYRSRVNRERAQVSRLGINSVPKMTVEGRFVQGSSINPACLDHMVEGIELEG